jgi:four helix bundle protein
MNEQDLKTRSKEFALRVLRMVEALPRSLISGVLGRQIARSSTSVAANYRAVCRARSRADFIAKLGLVEEEVDETAFWLEMIVDAGLQPAAKLAALSKEADELTAIFVQSLKTARDSPVNPKSRIGNPK